MLVILFILSFLVLFILLCEADGSWPGEDHNWRKYTLSQEDFERLDKHLDE